jgi:hypothetical protein
MEAMLEELGIDKLRITQDGSDYVVEFIAKLSHDQAARKIRINVPINVPLGADARRIKRQKDMVFRVLYYHLKNRFVTIANGLREFDEEFASDIVMVINGQEQRLGDIIVPKIKEQLRADDKVVLKITN